jgi:hypothetical protein
LGPVARHEGHDFVDQAIAALAAQLPPLSRLETPDELSRRWALGGGMGTDGKREDSDEGGNGAAGVQRGGA